MQPTTTPIIVPVMPPCPLVLTVLAALMAAEVDVGATDGAKDHDGVGEYEASMLTMYDGGREGAAV
jgi:hypothetical protein